MNVLLDECAPRAVERLLPEYDISTVQEVGWSGLKYGELLAAAEGKFDLFIATDKNLRHQQNLTKYKLAVILLPSNSVPVVVAVTADIEAALVTIQARDFVEILAPTVQVIPADIVPRVDSFKGLISKNGRVAR